MSLTTTPAIVLTDAQRAALAARPDLAARFDELLFTAVQEGPGRPGSCRQNPFWVWDSSGAELSGSRLFAHAEYTVGLERGALQVAA